MLPISNEHILTENLDFIKNPQKSKKKRMNKHRTAVINNVQFFSFRRILSSRKFILGFKTNPCPFFSIVVFYLTATFTRPFPFQERTIKINIVSLSKNI